jgi:hypothetical protein
MMSERDQTGLAAAEPPTEYKRQVDDTKRLQDGRFSGILVLVQRSVKPPQPLPPKRRNLEMP